MLQQSFPLIHDGINPIGWMDKDGWNNVLKILLETTQIQDMSEPEGYYTTQFINTLE